MSNREKAVQLLDSIPDYKMSYVVAYLQGISAGEEETPNQETIAAMQEVEEMAKTGAGQHFETVEDLFADLED